MLEVIALQEDTVVVAKRSGKKTARLLITNHNISVYNRELYFIYPWGVFRVLCWIFE